MYMGCSREIVTLTKGANMDSPGMRKRMSLETAWQLRALACGWSTDLSIHITSCCSANNFLQLYGIWCLLLDSKHHRYTHWHIHAHTQTHMYLNENFSRELTSTLPQLHVKFSIRLLYCLFSPHQFLIKILITLEKNAIVLIRHRKNEKISITRLGGGISQ